MLPELSARLSRVIERKRRREKLEGDLRAVEAGLRDQTSHLDALEAQLEKEKVDIEKLERTSLARLFYTVLGSREEQLEKERQELLSAQLRYQQTRRQVEYLKGEQDHLNQQIAGLAGIEAEYDSLLVEKERLLRQSGQAAAGELLEIAEQIALLSSEEKEISEAIDTGKQVISGLGRVLGSLESAKDWGAWDILAGGVLSTAIKHDRIDDARRGIHQVQSKMSCFERELADVREQIRLEIEIGDFEHFADFFFDGLIIDWVVQSKISESLERTKEAKRAIGRVVKELERLQQDLHSQVSDVEARRTQLIERA